MTETQIERVKEILLEYYEPAEALEWLFTNQTQLGGLTAIHMLANGHGPDVLAVLERLEAAVYL